MNELFLKIINMSISASWLILAVLILRLVLKKAPKWVNVLLWGIVAVRLICPLSFESALSLIPSSETIPLDIEMAAKPTIDSGVPAINSVVNPVLSSFAPPQHVLTSANPLQIWIPILNIIWLIGVGALLLYTAVSYWRLCRKVDTAVRYKGNIFQSENVSSPFVLGIIKPRIYLPFNMNGQDLEHVVAHEQAHIRRKDHWWKPLGFLLLTIHWFNPLAWAMFALANQDIELSCDEAVLKRLGCKREDYAMALIRLEEKRSISAGAAFGRNAVRERIEVIMKFKKTTLAGIIVSACLIAGTTTAFAAVNSDGYTREEVPAETETADVTDLDSNEYADVEWWTYDEYKAWLEQEKKNIAELVKQGAAGWTQSSGDFIWTQDIADETIALYEQNLEDIKNGAHISKPVNGSYDDIVYSYYQVEDGADVHLSTDESYQTTAEEDGTVYISDDTTDAYTTIEHYISDEELYSKYEKYGLTYRDGRLYYNGEAVKYFDDTVAVDDTITEIIAYLDSDGTVALTAEREGSDSGLGELTGIRVVPEEEYITVNTGFVS